MATYKSKYTGGQIDEAIGKALEIDDFKEEVEEFIANGSASIKAVKGITVASSGWVDETETSALWRYRIEHEAITEGMSVDVLFDVADYTEEKASSLVLATNAGILAATTANLGCVDIYSTSQPDSDLLCQLLLTGLKEV